MQLVNLPEPIEMRCFSCGTMKLHAPVVIKGDVRYQCITCGNIKLTTKETVREQLNRD